MLRNFEAAIFSLVHGFQMFVADNVELGLLRGTTTVRSGMKSTSSELV